MDKNVMKLAGAALFALGALQLAAPDAFAAKEKFVRNKPHVNVGTIGPASSGTPAGSMTMAPTETPDTAPDCEPDPSKVGESPPPPCEPAN
jgi:hypothetical protein